MARFEKGNKFGKISSRKGVPNRAVKLELNNMFEDLIGSFKSGSSYVYYHVDKKTRDVMYIGKGVADRAWSRHNRNSDWLSYTNDNEIEVRIIASNISSEEALAIETALIKIRKPILNIKGVEE